MENYKTYKLIEITPGKEIVQENLSDVPAVPAHQIFIIGNQYLIKTNVLTKLYTCKAYIDFPEENKEECLDIVIMKPSDDSSCTLWSLSEDDCEFLHIDYEKGLLAFPATYDFTKLTKKYK